MNNAIKIGGILLLLQGLLLVAFFVYSRRREATPQGLELLGPAKQTTGELLQIAVQERGAPASPLVFDARPTLLHFWGTWCQPCREELPQILALDGPKVRVLAVALHDEWEPVDSFFEGEVPSQVVLGSSEEVQSRLAVHALPVTFLIRPGLPGAARFDGPRAWNNEEWRAKWLSPDEQ